MNEKETQNHHFHGRGRPFHRGDFKYILLQHLKDKPSYGYEIIRALEERFHSFYSPSPGSVYPTLQMLEEMGYVSSGETEGKKVYSITAEGTAFLEENREAAEKINGRILNWWNPENIEEVRETMLELRKLSREVREKARTAGPEALLRMKNVLSRAREEVTED